MTHLRKMMLEELERRNYSENTKETYIQAVEDFAHFFHRAPDRLGLEHIRQFQSHLFTERRMAPNTVNQRLAALRFFFVKTLHRPWNAEETPYPKKVVRLPIVLSQDEVARLIDSAVLPFHRVILMTLYGTGVRRAELAHLKVGDIDSERMVIRIRGGKGRKDREVMLSATLLHELREHWKRYKPKEWLFPGGRWHNSTRPMEMPAMRRSDDCRFSGRRSHPVPALSTSRIRSDSGSKLEALIETAFINPVGDRASHFTKNAGNSGRKRDATRYFL